MTVVSPPDRSANGAPTEYPEQVGCEPTGDGLGLPDHRRGPEVGPVPSPFRRPPRGFEGSAVGGPVPEDGPPESRVVRLRGFREPTAAPLDQVT